MMRVEKRLSSFFGVLMCTVIVGAQNLNGQPSGSGTFLSEEVSAMYVSQKKSELHFFHLLAAVVLLHKVLVPRARCHDVLSEASFQHIIVCIQLTEQDALYLRISLPYRSSLASSLLLYIRPMQTVKTGVESMESSVMVDKQGAVQDIHILAVWDGILGHAVEVNICVRVSSKTPKESRS